MGSVTPSFPVLTDPRPEDHSLPAFMVSTTRGFLPRADPIVTLPPEFSALESLLQRMPIRTASGEPGLLAQGKFGEAVETELPDLTEEVEKYKHDLPMVNALYRDYSFVASAYLLEPCHLRWLKGEGYGLGRERLPRQVARPIWKCAEICKFQPFMEYAGSYALYNYRLVDPSLGLSDPTNVRLIRAFEHGLDPSSSEAGFVLVHIEMAKHSGLLVSAALDALAACSSQPPSRTQLNTALSNMESALKTINAAMETMWARSKPMEYTSFRTFIFGITSQPMFPNGVIYEGVDEFEGKPQRFRGESGANDSMVPLVDNLLGVEMPDTPLTAILKDFRRYRPSNHREFLEWVKDAAETANLKKWALETDSEEGYLETRALWLKVLHQIRDFRWRHWCFAREYIIKRTMHPTATGGSPIVTWLPNQLGAVLDEMERLYGKFGGEEAKLGAEVDGIMDLVRRQRDMLAKEVRKFCEERGVKE